LNRVLITDILDNYFFNILSIFVLVAMNALKRKVWYDKHSTQIDGILLIVVKQRLALESANTNSILANVMKSTLSTVKISNENM